jgi:hypothetical protein
MNMRKIVIAFAVLLMPSLALAGGHSGLGGNGTGITVDNEVMEGKTGFLVKNTTSDVWTWDNPPEGFLQGYSSNLHAISNFCSRSRTASGIRSDMYVR